MAAAPQLAEGLCGARGAREQRQGRQHGLTSPSQAAD